MALDKSIGKCVCVSGEGQTHTWTFADGGSQAGTMHVGKQPIAILLHVQTHTQHCCCWQNRTLHKWRLRPDSTKTAEDSLWIDFQYSTRGLSKKESQIIPSVSIYPFFLFFPSLFSLFFDPFPQLFHLLYSHAVVGFFLSCLSTPFTSFTVSFCGFMSTSVLLVAISLHPCVCGGFSWCFLLRAAVVDSHPQLNAFPSYEALK